MQFFWVKFMKNVIEKIKSAKSMAVLTHINEDPDTLGSAFAFCVVMRDLGKEAICYVSQRPQKKFDFIGDDYAVYTDDVKHNHDLCVCIDCGDIDRLGDRRKLFDEINNSVNIDHHMTNTNFADANYIEGESSATGETLVRIFNEMGIVLDDVSARFLYIAICSDTGCFKYSSVSPRTLRIVADLIGYDFDHAREARLLFDSDSIEIAKFKAGITGEIESYCDGKIRAVTIMRDMYKKYNIPENEAPNPVDIPRRIAGTEIALCFKEKENAISVNFRSNGEADVAKAALEFGGGGHAKAAGCTVEGAQMEEIKQAVIYECIKAIEKINE